MTGNENPFAVLDPDPDILSPGASKKPRNNKRDKINVTAEYFPQLSNSKTTNNEPKFITGKCSDANQTFNNLNCFIVKKSLESVSKEISKVSFSRDGSITIKCNNKIAAEKFLKTKSLISGPNSVVNVTFTINTRLSCSKGVVYSPLLKNLSESEIVDGLKEQLVLEARHITKKLEDDKYINTGAICLTFDRFTLPSSINICYSKASVREYIQNPFRCRKCQLLGHTTNKCSAIISTCSKCQLSEGHSGSCNLFCLNCKKEGHGSDDRNCPTYAIEREVLRIMNQLKCTKYEAKKTYYNSLPCNPVSPAVSFASTISQVPTSASLDKTGNNNCPTTPLLSEIPQNSTKPIKSNEKVTSVPNNDVIPFPTNLQPTSTSNINISTNLDSPLIMKTNYTHNKPKKLVQKNILKKKTISKISVPRLSTESRISFEEIIKQKSQNKEFALLPQSPSDNSTLSLPSEVDNFPQENNLKLTG